VWHSYTDLEAREWFWNTDNYGSQNMVNAYGYMYGLIDWVAIGLKKVIIDVEKNSFRVDSEWNSQTLTRADNPIIGMKYISMKWKNNTSNKFIELQERINGEQKEESVYSWAGCDGMARLGFVEHLVTNTGSNADCYGFILLSEYPNVTWFQG
jgi:hypothetical protein